MPNRSRKDNAKHKKSLTKIPLIVEQLEQLKKEAPYPAFTISSPNFFKATAMIRSQLLKSHQIPNFLTANERIRIQAMAAVHRQLLLRRRPYNFPQFQPLQPDVVAIGILQKHRAVAVVPAAFVLRSEPVIVDADQ